MDKGANFFRVAIRALIGVLLLGVGAWWVVADLLAPGPDRRPWADFLLVAGPLGLIAGVWLLGSAARIYFRSRQAD